MKHFKSVTQHVWCDWNIELNGLSNLATTIHNQLLLVSEPFFMHGVEFESYQHVSDIISDWDDVIRSSDIISNVPLKKVK